MMRWGALAGLVLTLSIGDHALAETCAIAKLAELPVTMVNSQPTVQAKINGQDVRLLVDTGAFHGMLSPATAVRLKLPVVGRLGVEGFGGIARVGVTTVETFELAGASRRAMQFVVGHGVDNLDGLLGNDVLAAFDVEYDLANGVVRFFHTTGCTGAALAYWAGQTSVAVASLHRSGVGDSHILSSAQIDGRPLQVLFDTGASASFLRSASARRLGVATAGGGVTAEESGRGVGSAVVRMWSAPIESFELGGEKVLHTRARLGDGDLPDADMVLGVDFFLSHRIFISRSVRQIIFTYNGGPVFDLPPVDLALAKPSGPAPIDPAAASAVAPASGDPTDADGWSRRGLARQARGDANGALADLSQAVKLAPEEVRYRMQRAGLYEDARRSKSALLDLDAAIVLKPNDPDIRVKRAELRIRVGDMAGAESDLAAAAPLLKSDRQQLQLAGLYAHAEKFDTAIALLNRWIAVPRAPGELGYALEQRCFVRTLANKELDAALADCNHAVRLTWNAPAALGARGLVHVRRGEFAQAMRDYDEALKIEPKDGWLLYGRSLAEARTGAHVAAENDRIALAAIDPDLAPEAARYGLTP